MNVKSTIQWATPYSLGLLLAFAIAVLAVFALLRWSSGRPIAIARRPALLVLRLAILAILGVIIINPVRVDETPGIVERPRLFYLLDTSQSMAIGKHTTRWDQVVQTLRDAEGTGDPRAGAQISTFQFGSGLAAVSGDFWRPEAAKIARGSSAGAVLAAEAPRPGEPPPAPTDPDTLLGASLEGLAHRFGQTPPQAVVVFSDGRARDSDKAGTIARAYSRMKVPVHVSPRRRRERRWRCRHRQHGCAESGAEVFNDRRAGLRAELRLQGPTRRAEDRGRRAAGQPRCGPHPHANRPG